MYLVCNYSAASGDRDSLDCHRGSNARVVTIVNYKLTANVISSATEKRNKTPED